MAAHAGEEKVGAILRLPCNHGAPDPLPLYVNGEMRDEGASLT